MEPDRSEYHASVSAARAVPRRQLLPMDPQLTTIQPGGGLVIRIEQTWGHVRRWWLKTFRAGYVRHMAACRQGDFNPCPHEVLDPRDLKFHVNQGGWHWRKTDDPFRWRDRLPFVRDGLAELLLMCGLSFAICAAAAAWAASADGAMRIVAGLVSVTAAVIGILIAWFFRNPWREVPQAPGLIVSPADGRITDVEDIPHDDFIGGPAKKIGIFLSIFNVHINRCPVDAIVIGLVYRPGKCLNALRPESARENEQLAVLLEARGGSHRGMIVRQITGAIARRIVCHLKPGDSVGRGQVFGMIKLGSRTELVLPAEAGLEICVKPGDRVCAGTDVLARYPESSS
jgi:phosphatidylserine decarboxylase